ncbi:hypothetical protein D3C87_1734180 [compost metagenome]
MGHAVKHQVFVDFVAENVNVAATNQIRQLIQFGTTDQRPARIVRRIENNHPRAWRDRLSELLEIDGKIVQPELHMHATPASQFRGRFVTVVARIENDDFVAAVDNGLNRAEDPLGGARRDGHFVVGIDMDAVAAGDLRHHLLTQRRQPGHR